MSKTTIIKILPKGEELQATNADIERWKKIFSEHKMTLDQAQATDEVEVETVEQSDTGEQLMIVKIGSQDYVPTAKDLESFRDIFAQAKTDPEFKIFTHSDVDVSVINVGDIVTVE